MLALTPKEIDAAAGTIVLESLKKQNIPPPTIALELGGPVTPAS